MKLEEKKKGGCYVHTYPFKYIFKNHYEIDKHKAQVEFQNIKQINIDRV